MKVVGVLHVLFSALLLCFFSSATVDAASVMVSVEPDHFREGKRLKNAFKGVRLSVEGKRRSVVKAVSGFSAFNGRNLATTGSLVFGQSPVPSSTVPQGWDENLGLLRADFRRPVKAVGIDIIYDDNDEGWLRAFDASGTLLETVRGSGDGRGPNAVLLASIDRPLPDISYILAGGVGKEAVFLDNMTSFVPVPAALPLFASALMGLGFLGWHRRTTRSSTGRFEEPLTFRVRSNTLTLGVPGASPPLGLGRRPTQM